MSITRPIEIPGWTAWDFIRFAEKAWDREAPRDALE
jgi:hypothetical protein